MKTGYFEKEFGIDHSLCHRLLETALSRGGDFADLYFEHTISNALGLEDGTVNRASGSNRLGVGIRTVKGDQVGYGFTQILTEESMQSAARTASSLVNTSASPVAGKFSQTSTGEYYPVDPGLIQFPVASKIPFHRVNFSSVVSMFPLPVLVRSSSFDDTKMMTSWYL